MRAALDARSGNAAQKVFVITAELTALACGPDQIRAASLGQCKGLLPPPSTNSSVVPRSQHRRDFLALPVHRLRVVRAIQQADPGRKTVLLGRLGIAQHIHLKPGHSIQQRQGGNLTAREDKVAKAQFDVDFAVDKTLVHTLVATTQKNGTFACGHLAYEALVQPAPCGTEKNQRHACTSPLPIGPYRIHGASQHGCLHHHARTATAGSVIDPLMKALAKVPQRPTTQVDTTALVGPPRHAQPPMGVEEFGEQGQNVEAHGDGRGGKPFSQKSKPQSTRMRRALRSTLST